MRHRLLLVVILLLGWALPGQAAYALVTSTGAQALSTSGQVTTAGVDTSGANLLVCVASFYHGTTTTLTFSDSKSNTWTARTAYSSTNRRVVLAYVYGGTVGAAHTFSFNSTALDQYATLTCAAFSWSTASPFGQETGTFNDSATTLATGSLTPAQDNELIVTGVAKSQTGTTPSVDSGFTISSNNAFDSIATAVGGGLAWKVQTTAAAVNPTWTAGSGEIAVGLWTFKAPGGVGGGSTGALLLGVW